MPRIEARALALAAAAALMVILVAGMIMAYPSGPSESISSPEKGDLLVWTKAICNERNYCIDVQITCANGNLVDLKPLGEGVYFSGKWKDPRPEESRSEWC